MYPDKDGLPVYVRSNEELKLCAILTSLGVSYNTNSLINTRFLMHIMPNTNPISPSTMRRTDV